MQMERGRGARLILKREAFLFISGCFLLFIYLIVSNKTGYCIDTVAESWIYISSTVVS